MENDRFESLLPSNDQLISRANVWKNYEKKFANAEEDPEYCFDFVTASQEEEEDQEDNSETDGSFVEEEETGSKALVTYFDPKKLFESRLVPLIKKKSYTLTEQIRKMEFHGKVSDWLKNNAQHMAEPIFLDNNTPQFPGRFRMRQFNATEMDFNYSNASSASVDTAAYIRSNQRQKVSQRTFRMTVKEFCVMEQDTDLLRFERELPWRPIEIPRRSLAPQYLNDRRFPAIGAPAERLVIEYPQQREESPPKNHYSRIRSSQRKRKKPSRFDSSDSDEENSSTSNNQKKPSKRMVGRPLKGTKEAPAKDRSKKKTANPTEIVIYKPKPSGHKFNENIQVTLEMLAAKIGREDAECLKNHSLLKFPMPASSTLVYSITDKNLKELMAVTLISSDENSDGADEKASRFDSSDSDEKNHKEPPKRKVGWPRKPKKAPAKDKSKKETTNPTEIVIYKPEKSGCKWNENVQVTLEMLAAKIGKEDAECLKNHSFLKFPIPASSTLVYSITNKNLKELMGVTLISSDEDSDETDEENFLIPPRIKQERRESVQEDIVIYEPPETKRKSHKTIRITGEMLRKKLDKKTFESLTDTPYLKFPFPEASTLLFNFRTKKLYEKFA